MDKGCGRTKKWFDEKNRWRDVMGGGNRLMKNSAGMKENLTYVLIFFYSITYVLSSRDRDRVLTNSRVIKK